MAALRMQVGGRCSETEVEISLQNAVLLLGASEVKLQELIMASVTLRKGQLEIVLTSRHVDFMELKMTLTPKAAELVQAIREHVELTEIPRSLLRWPLRTLQSALRLSTSLLGLPSAQQHAGDHVCLHLLLDLKTTSELLCRGCRLFIGQAATGHLLDYDWGLLRRVAHFSHLT